MSEQKAKAEKVKEFELLVEELLKDEPNENAVKSLMENLEMTFEANSVGRLGQVLEKMNNLVFESKPKKGNYDLR